jgi:predicted RecB family nuclease
MSLPEAYRAKIVAVALCGPRTADFLDMIGIESFDALADANAAQLRLAVNAALGRPLINAMGARAFQNAIDAARAARLSSVRQSRSDHSR